MLFSMCAAMKSFVNVSLLLNTDDYLEKLRLQWSSCPLKVTFDSLLIKWMGIVA